MNLLLDSNVVLWLMVEPDRIASRARQVLAEPGAQRYFSAASPWEIAIKSSEGKLHLPPRWFETLLELGLRKIDISPEDGIASARLPWHHSDPFDRIIVTHAISRNLMLVTRDTFLATYGVQVVAA